MGIITRSFVNGLTTNGVLGASNINNASLNNITSISGPEMTLISSATASNSASIEFSLGNYKEYQFFFVNIHQSIDQAYFQVNFSTDNGSNYNVTKTTSAFNAFHTEADSTEFVYASSTDVAQSTANANLSILTGNGDDENQSGYLHLFNPSSTTYVKHFISDLQCNYRVGLPASVNYKVAGYANTTSALTNIKFEFSSGNIDAGEILLFGIN
jgi:hypothetical protein